MFKSSDDIANDLVILVSDYQKYKAFYDKVRREYYAPPLDIPPQNERELKSLANRIEMLLDEFDD